MKKIISILVIISLFMNNLLFTTFAVETNNSSSPWTIEKATHLARKALYGATKEKIQELYNAGSAEAAINILFPSIEGPNRADYNTKMASLLDNSWLIETSNNNMREYYALKKLYDPYGAKSKLFGLFEDTFSVDTIRNRINYGDIEDNHNLLYSYTLGDYKEMIKRNLYNNGNKGDYALSEYLDLLNQKYPNSPNENYSREIIQLFLMLEYIPTESEDLGNTRNYTERDVNALAKILFGFEADENTHKVTYNNEANTNTEITFLSGTLDSGDSFPFYNSQSGTLDIQKMKISIAGNNGLPDNTIDYIFSKRKYQISMFLADKFYRFYIAENPSRENLDIISNKILENNFEIYPTIKWLLASDMMYTDKSMNSVIYKNPLELIIGTIKTLGLENDSLDLKYSLSNLSWTPYHPGKIFGRDGYDNNSVFFTPYISNKWTRESSIFAKTFIENHIDTLGNITTATGIIDKLEEKIYLGRKVDTYTKNKLIEYLTHDKDGNKIEVDLSNINYVKDNIHLALYIMLNQPEYVLQSGYDINSNTNSQTESFYKNDSKLVFIKASGGLDWLHAIVPKNEYQEYLNLRASGALVGTGLLSLNNDYYINSQMSEFKDLFDSGNLKIINRVGTPSHSRGHDSASRKITSIDNTYKGTKGIFGDLIKNENPSKTIVLDGGTKPFIFRNGNYMGIGSEARYQVYGTNPEYKKEQLKNIFKNRNFLGDFGETFKNSAIIDDVANESVANGGRPGSGYNMEQKFTFLESLYNGGLGNAVWLRADGGYDTHRNQKDYLNSNLKKVSKTTSDFFKKVKNKYNVTIVIYSEFGRTNKLNSTSGVDHGMGGGMFIISNNQNLIKKELPKKVYGNLSFKDSEYNWLGVGIDYRSVYSKIYKALYNIDISNKLGGIFDINDYIDKTNPNTELLRYDYTLNYTHIKFNIDDKNFFSSEASHLLFEYWTEDSPIRELSKYTLHRYEKGEKEYDITLRTSWNTKYYYKLTIFDNQYNKKIINGSFNTPISINNGNELSLTGSTVLSNFRNKSLNNPINLTNSSTGIILSNSGTKVYIGDNSNKLIANSGTYITEITGGTGITWNGIFQSPTEIIPETFLGTNTKFNGESLSKYKVDKIIKVGANTLGVGMKLNQNVIIEVSNINSNSNYKILTSEDGIEWTILNNSNIKINGNTLQFNTNHFSYFALVQSNNNGILILNNPIVNQNNNTVITSNNYSSGGGGGVRLVKDKCEYGDFSPSYYDRTCGIDPFTIHSNSYDSSLSEIYIDLKNDLKSINGNKKEINKYKTEKEMQLAYIELKIKNEEKAKIYENLFTEELVEKIKEKEENTGVDEVLKNINTKKEVLILLREKLSFIKVGNYNLVHIKQSNLNNIFEKIAKLIIRKKFTKKIENESFVNLNKVIIYSAINELENIDNITKDKNKILLKKSIQNLVKPFKKNNIKKKIVLKKKETIKEKIIRINAKKKAMIH